MSNEDIHIDGVSHFRAIWAAAGLLPSNADAPVQQLEPRDTPESIAAYIRRQRLEKFREQCPEEFRQKIDVTKIPNRTAWDAADKWDGSHPGLWLWSRETGRAKTRMLWRQFGRLHVERGLTVIKITGQAMAEEYFSYHMDGDPRAFYSWLMGYSVVMIDDLDKLDLDDKRAPRMCRELFDEMYANQKPVLVTANEPISHFQKRIGNSTSRRMEAVCREIQF